MRQQKNRTDFFVVGVEPIEVSLLVEDCRQQGWKTNYDPSFSSFKSQFKQAGKLEVDLVLVLGEEEIQKI